MRNMHLLGLLASSASLSHAQNWSESYAPVYVDCPSDATFTRSASEGLHPDEEVWLHHRKKVVAGALSHYLSNARLKDFDIDAYLSGLNRSNFDAVPGIGLAISGGGYVSAITGAGVIRALDGREEMSSAAGTGGILQAMSFLSGQSGGSWVASSYTAAQLPLSEALLEYWQPQLDRLGATTNGTHEATIESIILDVAAKEQAGFSVSVSDLLGRINSYEFIEGPRGGLDKTMAGIRDLPKFQTHEMPLLIVQIAQVTDRDPTECGLVLPTIKTPIVGFPLELRGREQPTLT